MGAADQSDAGIQKTEGTSDGRVGAETVGRGPVPLGAFAGAGTGKERKAFRISQKASGFGAGCGSGTACKRAAQRQPETEGSVGVYKALWHDSYEKRRRGAGGLSAGDSGRLRIYGAPGNS